MCIYDNCLGGYVYIKYATESPKTGASNKLYITCRHAGHLFKFKHNMSRGSFSWHILPTYIVVRRSVIGLPFTCNLAKAGHLWALAWGRTWTLGNFSIVVGMIFRLFSILSKSIIIAGVSISCNVSPTLHGAGGFHAGFMFAVEAVFEQNVKRILGRKRKPEAFVMTSVFLR